MSSKKTKTIIPRAKIIISSKKPNKNDPSTIMVAITNAQTIWVWRGNDKKVLMISMAATVAN
jgi:hypothetical protein